MRGRATLDGACAGLYKCGRGANLGHTSSQIVSASQVLQGIDLIGHSARLCRNDAAGPALGTLPCRLQIWLRGLLMLRLHGPYHSSHDTV